ncbi:NAD-dependent epimerase/dehydratase family protein [Shewanella sp. HL-SH5]|uniref:NAD-dependent epimerase/dehydratase family protein n=1 Tax=Shewanella sp. HL-SH5 TaxID=3436241 RepID=UPI003EBDECCD
MFNSSSTEFCPESVLLTGSSGFIGSYVNRLLDYRCAIARRVFDPKLSNERQVSISDIIESQTSSLLNETQVIIHLANLAHATCYTSLELQSVNVDLTLNLARKAANLKVKRFIYVSSILVNGINCSDSPFSSESKASPNSPYAKSKWDAEVGLKKIAQETGLEVVIIRPTLVYGPNAPGNFGLLSKLVQKLPFLPFGFVNNKRDFIAVQNLADLLMTCSKHPNAAGHTFLASDGHSISTKEFTNAIAKGLGKSAIQIPVPVSVMRIVAKCVGRSAMIEQLVGNLEVDSSNLQDVLSWTPPYTMEQAMDSLSGNNK